MPLRPTLVKALAAAGLMFGLSSAAQAFGALGHQTVGDIAAQLIQGSRAEHEVARILGTTTLHDMAVWADCVKGIDPASDFRYTVTGRFPECAVFENKPDEEARMRDYVQRNNEACQPKPGEESCHKQYHYTNPALERGHYTQGAVGTSDHDIVGALKAAIVVLKGGTAPAPFALNEREALAVLVHDLGDLHQPLHVGSIYLDAQGQRVDPDKAGDDLLNRTIGGNALVIQGPKGPGGNLHAYWDGAPNKLNPQELAGLAAEARSVPVTHGAPQEWPAAWASETMQEAEKCYQGLSFGERQQTPRGSRWMVTLPEGYDERARGLVHQQLVRGGARLAQLLQSIWP